MVKRGSSSGLAIQLQSNPEIPLLVYTPEKGKDKSTQSCTKILMETPFVIAKG